MNGHLGNTKRNNFAVLHVKLWLHIEGLPLVEIGSVPCRWARRGTSSTGKEASVGVASSWEETSSAYSPSTLRSLELVDENQVNYDLLEALVVHIVDTESAHGPGALLRVCCPVLASLLFCAMNAHCHIHQP